MSLTTLLDAETAPVDGDYVNSNTAKRTVQATVTTSAGAADAVVEIQGSNDKINWLVLATIALSGTIRDSDGAALESPWAYIRAAISSISGTDATVNVIMETQP